MPTRFYFSNDAGSPGNLSTGTAGSFIALLDACLVNGYGSKASAGWVKHTVSATVAVYEPGAGFPKKFLRVSHALGQGARVRGYDTLDDALAGTESLAWPTDSQAGSGGLYPVPSAYTYIWWLAADEQTFYFGGLETSVGSSFSAIPPASNVHASLGFGQFKTYFPGDTNNWFIFGGPTSGALTGTLQTHSLTGHYTSRNALGDAPPPSFSKHYLGLQNQVGHLNGYSYPDAHTGKIRLQSRVRVLESVAGSILWRGELPGLAFPISSAAGRYFQQIDGEGALAGRSWLVVPVGRSGGGTSLWAIDQGTWSH